MGEAHSAKLFGLFLALAWVLGAVGPAVAFDASRIVRFPDGTAINLGPHARIVERAVDRGGLTALAGGYLDRNQSTDAAAVLVYAVRCRPGRTPQIAESAARLAQQYQDQAWTSRVFTALAAEPAMLPEILAEALDEQALPEALAATAYRSADLPVPAGRDGPVQERDVAAETDGSAASDSTQGLRTAGEVFDGTLLPETLRIGGGGGGAANGPNTADPSDDGGAT